MGWQDAGVALIVLGAAAFLARKVFAREPKKPAGGFVPLKDLKSRPCHVREKGDSPLFRYGLIRYSASWRPSIQSHVPSGMIAASSSSATRTGWLPHSFTLKVTFSSIECHVLGRNT